MNGVVVVDTNLLVLLVVGSASRSYIATHRRLQGYSDAHFDLLVILIGQYSKIVLLPHILSEVSSLARQIGNPARRLILDRLKTLIQATTELPIESAHGAERDDFIDFGLTDAVILQMCGLRLDGMQPTLVTVDGKLADRAHALGLSVVDFKAEYFDE